MKRNSLRLAILIVILALCVVSNFPVLGLIPWLKKPARILSHDQLTNREKWLDVINSNPIGKMYNFYHEAKEVGLDVTKFSLYEYGDHPNDHSLRAKEFKKYKNTEFGNKGW